MRFDSHAVKRRLSALSSFRKLALVLLLCQRGWPALEKFSHDTGFDISPHPKALNEGWLRLGGSGGKRGEYAAMARRCLDGCPHTEDFTHPLTSAALDAGLSIGLMMKFLAGGQRSLPC
jgi:hypothetical protein